MFVNVRFLFISLKAVFIPLVVFALFGFVSIVNAQDMTRQSAEMIDFETGEVVRGGGVLTRSESEVSARLSTMDLDKKAAYTVWWIVFNFPEECSDPGCGEDDIFLGPGMLNWDQINAAGIAVFYADGFVTGTDGVANATAHLKAGELPVGTHVNFSWNPDTGLAEDNGLDAEIHMVVRTHGKAVAGVVGVQTSVFPGYCDVNDCADQQAIIFPPAP